MPSFSFDFAKNHSIASRVTLALLAVATITVVAGCGASESDAGSVEGNKTGTVDEEGLRLITQPDAVYTVDDLTAVGYKKNRQFGAETVPGALDIWYGFFDQRDIEVRFYESHTVALDVGVGPAEVIIVRTAGQRDPLIPVVNLYPAYAVAGNTVMLCERQLATCEALIAALE